MEMYLLTDVATAILFQMKMFDYSDVTILQYKKFLIRLISLAHANGKDIFDAELFSQLIDKNIIDSNTSLRFRLKNGLELQETMERTVR